MNIFSYPITRDFGFAPNPFNGFCTLATCKPTIRKAADINDWVVATGPVTSYKKPGFLFYAMRVTEKLTFNQYWNDNRFQIRKPIFNGSLKLAYGDNIYYKDNNDIWHQANSHHSLANGGVNFKNLKNDTRYPFVLISNHFYYFGKSNVKIPTEFKEKICHNQRIPLYKQIDGSSANQFIDWILKDFQPGIYDDPMEFDKGFKRFVG